MSANETPIVATRAQAFTQGVTKWTGSTPAFAIALGAVLVWGITGPAFHYSDTWQLVMNTASSIVTFLMVFLIQRSQNKDALAMHVKLNEIVKAIAGASNRIVNVEDLSEGELQRLQERYQALAKRVAETSAGKTSEIPPR
jgi:low affinity Fe/Cu permease